ncbi:MAG: secretin and TonB N-terminal domain-containing protein, partial [Syntrophaceae bacterium]|nr:secretin and TonB N-terminal domain-containing protein [Syntrophaceae bacterium]
ASVGNVLLERIDGKERISILLSRPPDFTLSRESETQLLISLRGASLPDGAEKEYRGDGLRNLRNVVLYDKITEGAKEVGARVALRKMVPYRYRKDGPRVVVDFDVSALPPAEASDGGPAKAPPVVRKGPLPKSLENGRNAPKASQYTGEEVSLDFQDADIKSVFRLLSEISGYSIVAGPAVKSAVTVHMKNVPWDQALDAVLETNGLGKKESGHVITILPLEELKKAEEEQKTKDVAEGRLNQISIEAKIVEVTTTFAQELGVRWGAGLQSGNFAGGIGSSSSGTVTAIPGGSGVGLTGSNVAVNFPSVASAATPAIGLLYGTSKMILDARLSALENNGEGKIISSPKVTTLDSVTATIKQGEEIPYTVTDTDGKQTTEFKEATLKLEVTPKITSEGKISIKVNASNDYADWETDPATGLRIEKPPINTSSVESTVVVKDGDTIVIGGVYKETATDSVTGVPVLSRIPILGWLFKYKTVSNEKREL